MNGFIKLTNVTDSKYPGPVWINPAHISAIIPGENDEGSAVFLGPVIYLTAESPARIFRILDKLRNEGIKALKNIRKEIDREDWQDDEEE